MRREAASREQASISSADAQALDGLADELIRRANDSVPPTAADPVLLDLERHGLRCLLLRQAEAAEKIVLSPREQEIARMVAEGHPNRAIAAVLEISTWTVGTHLRRIFAKLGVSSRAAMVAKLLRK